MNISIINIQLKFTIINSLITKKVRRTIPLNCVIISFVLKILSQPLDIHIHIKFQKARLHLDSP